MKRASVILAVAQRDSAALRWLRIAADRRRNGLFDEARIAVRTSRIWPNPRLPDLAKPVLLQAAE